MKPFPLCLIAGAAFAVVPLAATAQTSAFVPAKLLAPGTNSTAPAGKGEVTVQVFVKKDGTFTVSRVIKSTNAGDNDAALEVAKSGKYKPALRDGKPADTYYDYVVVFSGDTAAVGTGPIANALASIRAAKYDDAKATLTSYLQAHAGDRQAGTLLGVANAFAGDNAAAAAAFDAAGTVPDQYKSLAIQAYGANANDLLKNKKYTAAIANANRLVEIDPTRVDAYYIRGMANFNAQNDAAAIADLQKARAAAVTAKVDDKTMATLAFALTQVQLDAGQFGEAATTIKDVNKLDPTRVADLNKYAITAVNNAGVELVNQGKFTDAVSRLESGATAFPASAAVLLGKASYYLALDKKPNWVKVAAEADKALAIDANEGWANYTRGVAYANLSDPRSAMASLTKAKASTAYATDPALAKQVDTALKSFASMK